MSRIVILMGLLVKLEFDFAIGRDQLNALDLDRIYTLSPDNFFGRQKLNQDDSENFLALEGILSIEFLGHSQLENHSKVRTHARPD
ncbi:hypothetical protein IQ266_02450 [filamentous cyanobacterium LEGE 11480]|uniref:Uncharacterized protein n=1 Tax=Romeriopsis navalis LEGE 11480 TaxID=2777977 RepID=A0A928VJ51_9CYAN|nr:hypothetical protein [Romeriopsis navalis]MBE9028617.1 hypothetical protein [Romeriopsis navalis LEGE 11480]